MTWLAYRGPRCNTNRLRKTLPLTPPLQCVRTANRLRFSSSVTALQCFPLVFDFSPFKTLIGCLKASAQPFSWRKTAGSSETLPRLPLPKFHPFGCFPGARKSAGYATHHPSAAHIRVSAAQTSRSRVGAPSVSQTIAWKRLPTRIFL
jgi:hypothetical protein